MACSDTKVMWGLPEGLWEGQGPKPASSLHHWYSRDLGRSCSSQPKLPSFVKAAFSGGPSASASLRFCSASKTLICGNETRAACLGLFAGPREGLISKGEMNTTDNEMYNGLGGWSFSPRSHHRWVKVVWRMGKWFGGVWRTPPTPPTPTFSLFYPLVLSPHPQQFTPVDWHTWGPMKCILSISALISSAPSSSS